MFCPAKRYMCVYYARFGLLGDFITSDNGINREDVEVLPYKSRGIAIVSFVGEGLRALPKSHREFKNETIRSFFDIAQRETIMPCAAPEILHSSFFILNSYLI